MILSIVILSYNTVNLVLDCVNSLVEQFKDELDKNEMEIIVLDNGSQKKSIDNLHAKLLKRTNVNLIKSEENLGFGRGCNLGAKKSKGDYVLFLNSDTQTKDKGFLEMANYLKENQNIAILGGKLLNPDGSAQKSAGKFYNLANFFIMLFGGEKFGLLKFSPSKIRRVDWVAGASMMVNKSYFEKIGGFDENIFMYAEDMELCFRLKKKGYLTYFYPNVSVIHKEQGSSNRTFAVVNIYKGILYFYKKHNSTAQYQIVRFFLWLKAWVVYLLGRITNNSYYTKTYGQALEVFK